jgi:hypothetical protein
MDRSLRQRALKVEKLVSNSEAIVSLAVKKEHQAALEEMEMLRPKALLHATAVAAVVIYGEPKIEEPLIRAWRRTLQHLRIIIRDEYGREYQQDHPRDECGREYQEEDPRLSRQFRESRYKREFEAAARELYPIIIAGGNEIDKFTEVFKTAPIWFLEFTWMRLDASVLKFELPRMSDKQVWGEEGLKDMLLRWPSLPLGRMTDGDLIPEVAPEEGVSAEQEEASRQRRRINNFLAALEAGEASRRAGCRRSARPVR